MSFGALPLIPLAAGDFLQGRCPNLLHWNGWKTDTLSSVNPTFEGRRQRRPGSVFLSSTLSRLPGRLLFPQSPYLPRGGVGGGTERQPASSPDSMASPVRPPRQTRTVLRRAAAAQLAARGIAHSGSTGMTGGACITVRGRRVTPQGLPAMAPKGSFGRPRPLRSPLAWLRSPRIDLCGCSTFW